MSILPDGILRKIVKLIVKYILNKYADIEVKGKENLKGLKGPIVFICNHLSNSDGLILNEVLKDFDPTFVAGVKLSENKYTNLGVLVVKTTPIRPETADKEGLSKIVEIAKKGENLLLFPEGTRSRNGKMIKAKRGLYLIARLTKATIVPMSISGSEILMPINEKMDKENFNHAKVTISFGKAFTLRTKNEDEDKKEYEANVVDECMYKIAALLPEAYRGEYQELDKKEVTLHE